jgi:hypothetical protein
MDGGAYASPVFLCQKRLIFLPIIYRGVKNYAKGGAFLAHKIKEKPLYKGLFCI